MKIVKDIGSTLVSRRNSILYGLLSEVYTIESGNIRMAMTKKRRGIAIEQITISEGSAYL